MNNYSFPLADSYISMTGIDGKTYYLFMDVSTLVYKPLQLLKQVLAKRTVDAPFVLAHTAPTRSKDNQVLVNIKLMVNIDSKETAIKLSDDVYAAVTRIQANNYTDDSTPTFKQDLATVQTYFKQ